MTATHKAWAALTVLMVILITYMMWYIFTDQGSYICYCKPKIGQNDAEWVKEPPIDGPCPPPKFEDLVCQ